GAELGNIGGVAAAIDVEGDVEFGLTGDFEGLEGGHDAAYIVQAGDEEEVLDGRLGGFDFSEIRAGDARIDDGGVPDAKAELFAKGFEGLAAKIGVLEFEAAEGIGRYGGELFGVAEQAGEAVVAFLEAGGGAIVEAAAFAAHFEGGAGGFFQQREAGGVPEAEPGIFADAGGEPVVENVEDDDAARMLEGEEKRLGKTGKAENVDDVGLELLDAFHEGLIVVEFHGLHFVEAGDEGVAKGAVEIETALDIPAALVAGCAVVGDKNADCVPAEAEGLDHVFTMRVKSPGVMRRIEVGEGQDSHVFAEMAAAGGTQAGSGARKDALNGIACRCLRGSAVIGPA